MYKSTYIYTIRIGVSMDEIMIYYFCDLMLTPQIDWNSCPANC